MREDTKKELQTFSYNVAWLRKKNGLTKKKMAQILGIGVVSLNKIERGEVPPRTSVEILFKIYNYFNIRPSELIAEQFGK